MSTNETIEKHVRSFFAGHSVAPKQWPAGPIASALPNHRVLEIGPGPRGNTWTSVTVGAWAARDDIQQEYLIISGKPNDRYVEILCMISFYGIEHTLIVGDTIPIGQPLLPGSGCEHVYLSLPYPYGPDLEVCEVAPGHIHLLWAFPISSAERDLLLEVGVEELEQRFEKQGVEYWNPLRKSVA